MQDWKYGVKLMVDTNISKQVAASKIGRCETIHPDMDRTDDAPKRLR